MRPALIFILAASLLAGCGSAEEGTQAAGTSGSLASVTVTVDDDGADGPEKPRELKLDCAKPTDSQACGAVAGISAADLQPVPKDMACTQIYGGPEEATIKGTIRGEPVDASFTRSDGCQIARWDGVKPLLDEVP